MVVRVVLHHCKEKCTLDVESTLTVGDLRKRIHEATGLLPENQRLFAGGRVSFNKGDGATLHECGFPAEGQQKVLVVATGLDRPAVPSGESDDDDDLPEMTEDNLCRPVGGVWYTCSYPQGHLTQDVFTCKTCSTDEPAGICAGCKEVCHAGHETVALWAKRAFRCDCGTPRLRGACQLGFKPRVAVNGANQYNQNFKGAYCTCKQGYHPEQVMVACVICQDWFHAEHVASEELPEEGVFVCRGCLTSKPFCIPTGRCHTDARYRPVLPGDTGERQLVDDPAEPPTKQPRQDSAPAVADAAPPTPSSLVGSFPGGVFIPGEFRNELCMCDGCRLVYETHDMQYLYKTSLDLNVSAVCVVADAPSDEDEADPPSGANPQGDPSGWLPPELNAEQRMFLLDGASQCVVELRAFLRSLPTGHVVTRADISGFFERLKKDQHARHGTSL